MTHLVRRAFAGAAAAVLLLVTGCADPAAPTAAEVPAAGAAPLFSSSTGAPDLSHIAQFRETPSITIAWAKKWIGPQGGRLDFQGFAIEVPAGAVAKRTQFSIRLPVDPNGAEHVVAEFGPHGATFALPVFIELPYAGTTAQGSDPSVGWWNPDVDAWEPFSTVLTADGLRMRTQTPHFSTFGAMGTTILVSGG